MNEKTKPDPMIEFSVRLPSALVAAIEELRDRETCATRIATIRELLWAGIRAKAKGEYDRGYAKGFDAGHFCGVSDNHDRRNNG